MSSLPLDQSHDALVIIPTVATPATLVPSFQRLIQNLDGQRVHIVLSVNPLDTEEADEAVPACLKMWEAYESQGSLDGCKLTVYRHPGPAGFGGAINLGLKAALGQGVPPLTVIFNDDLRVAKGWLLGLQAAMVAEEIEVWSEPEDGTGKRVKRSVADYGTIGMVGPVSNNAAGIQQLGSEEAEQFNELGVDEFTRSWAEEHQGRVMTANFLSGFCTGYSYEFMCALSEYDESGEFSWLFDERYLIAGYEDNDLCARSELAGFRAAVAVDTFVAHIGHQTFDRHFKDQLRGMRNRGIYYDVWKERRKDETHKLWAVMRVRLDVPNDWSMMRRAVIAASRVVDGFSVLLTGNPGDSISQEMEESKRDGIVHLSDLETMQKCNMGKDYQKPFRKWLRKWADAHPDTRKPEILCHKWEGEFNERVERNIAIRTAEDAGADWLFSIDHDEVIENRVTRAHFDRLMSHPDPMVQSYDVSFLTHWDGNRLVNLSPPWGDRGTYTGGMHGFRIWKVCKASPRKIQAGTGNGLHCGNSPDYDGICKRVAGIRMRHFGYQRPQDRWRKKQRYDVQDPNPNPLLVGGTGYGHLNHEENMVMQAYNPDNGIGLHMLVYEKESPEDVGRILDQFYGLVDRIVLVWTGAEEGPSPAMSQITEHFGVEWLHVPLNDNLGAARNAAVTALRGTKGMGWAMFLDPDEHAQNYYATLCSIRRMAECTDAWAWMFPFANVYEDGHHNESESIRMARLDEHAVMQITGRVHEGYMDSIKQLAGAGFGNLIRNAPFSLINTGLSKEPEDMERKFAKYRHLTELELQEHPHTSQAWVTLGLYWLNEGCPVTAMECMTRSVNCAGDSYMPYQEIALQYMRIAGAFMQQSVERMGQHKMRPANEAIIDFIERAAPAIRRQGLVATGERTPVSDQEAWQTLPLFPPVEVPSADESPDFADGEDQGGAFYPDEPPEQVAADREDSGMVSNQR